MTTPPGAELQRGERAEFGASQWQRGCPPSAANRRRKTVQFKPPPTSPAGTCPKALVESAAACPAPAREAGRRAGFPCRARLSARVAWGEAGSRANQGSSLSAAEQLATVVATFFESCVSREILGGDRAGPWLEVFAQVVGAGAAEVMGRAGGVAGWRERERQRGGSLLLRRSAETARGAGGRGGVAEPSPTHPHESPGIPCLGFPFLKCGHPLACLSRDGGSICQSSSETKAQGTSREWLLLIRGGGEGEVSPVSGRSQAGKGGESEARAQMDNLHCGERVGVDTAAGAFPLHALSQLCAAGATTGPRWPALG